ncbi:MAG TPA: amidohydrolase family protein, partial [Bacteroidales bacterium]|nr:amidohydrolase family protein [Bacteroidales bacterium]
ISCQDKHQSADMIITNAIIWTGNENQPAAEAMAISGDTIVAVGTAREIMKFRGDKTVVSDLNGKFVTPGFIDSHIHFLQGGSNLASVQLRDAATPEEFIMRLADFAKTQKPGTWILGGDWDGKGWKMLPERGWIDSVTAEHPVFVSRLDGHMGLANSLALKLAGIDRQVKNIQGGTIVRNKAGELTGIFKDNAMGLIFSEITSSSGEEEENALLAAMKYLASNGVTSVHAVDASGYAEAIEKLRKDDKLITRVYSMTPVSRWETLKERIERDGKGDRWLKYSCVKGFVDGSLGSHTAAFIEPYTDLLTDSGFFVNSEEDLYTWITESDKAGLQVAIHAIGDRAINFLLNTYERTEKENGSRDRRFRIEHAQHIAPGDIKRFADLNVIASMQPYHAIDDGRWAEEVIGPDRIKTTYAFKSLFDAGAKVAFGSDWPVAPATPLEGIYAAVTRRTLDDLNPEGWVPEQKITVEQALTAYTINGAFASFEENIKGTLEPGKLADFVILSDDITKLDPINIGETKVLQTYVGGKKVFDSNEK